MFTTILIPHAGSRAAEIASRSLVRAGYYVVLGYASGRKGLDRSCPQKNTSVIEHPCPVRDHLRFRDWLSDWLAQDKNALVLPISESVVHAADYLRSCGYTERQFVLPNSPSLVVALSKYRATLAAQRAGLPTPMTYFLREPGEISYEFPQERIPFPMLLKWDNAEFGDGIYEKGSNKIINSREELESCCAELIPRRCGVILQELVRGRGAGAFFLRHRGGNALRFAHRRLHEVPWVGGVSAYCTSSSDEETLRHGDQLLQSLNYEGLAMVEFRTEQDSPPIFLEINGRLWGSIGLALAAGADFPSAMIECHLNGKTTVKQPDLSRKVRWHDPSLEMDYLRSLWSKRPGPVDKRPRKFLAGLQVVSNFLDPTVKSDWWQWEDPFCTAKRYARFIRRELSAVKKRFFEKRPGAKSLLCVREAVERTRAWIENSEKANNILFVCYGNICRSPYAEQRWNGWKEEMPELPIAYSSGFYEKSGRQSPQRFQAVATHLELDLGKHRSRQLTEEQLAAADVVFVMDARNLLELAKKFPAQSRRVLLLGALGEEPPEIPDPYGQTIGAGGAVYRRIDRELKRLRTIVLKKV